MAPGKIGKTEIRVNLPPKAVVAVTHSGPFHADDVLAASMLRLAHSPREVTVVRSRNPGVAEGADIVFDVGMRHDPASGRFDHHMLNPPCREDGTPYSAAGLVWQRFGIACIETVLGKETDPELVRDVWLRLDRSLVVAVDRSDNGLGTGADSMLETMVSPCNMTWEDPAHATPEAADAEQDRRFARASMFVTSYLSDCVEHARSASLAVSLVGQYHRNSADPRILEMDRGLPWQEAVHLLGLPVLFSVYPGSSGEWIVCCMPPEPGSPGQKVPLPAAWAGLRDRELAVASGVPDALFVHRGRFVGGAWSKAGALAMAAKTLAARG